MHPLLCVNIDKRGLWLGTVHRALLLECQKWFGFPMSDESVPGSQSSHKGTFSARVFITFLT